MCICKTIWCVSPMNWCYQKNTFISAISTFCWIFFLTTSIPNFLNGIIYFLFHRIFAHPTFTHANTCKPTYKVYIKRFFRMAYVNVRVSIRPAVICMGRSYRFLSIIILSSSENAARRSSWWHDNLPACFSRNDISLSSLISSLQIDSSPLLVSLLSLLLMFNITC